MYQELIGCPLSFPVSPVSPEMTETAIGEGHTVSQIATIGAISLVEISLRRQRQFAAAAASATRAVELD